MALVASFFFDCACIFGGITVAHAETSFFGISSAVLAGASLFLYGAISLLMLFIGQAQQNQRPA